MGDNKELMNSVYYAKPIYCNSFSAVIPAHEYLL